jgi:hypothetical protein
MDDDRTTAWLTAAKQQLGLDDVRDDHALASVDDLGELVASSVGSAASARTMFLLGMAAGRSADAPVATADHVTKLATLAEGWDADTERAEAPNRQADRA